MKINLFIGIVLIFQILYLFSCSKKYDYRALDTFDGLLVNAVIEVPRGHEDPIFYDEQTMTFMSDSFRFRHVNGLPIPANIGFVANTKLNDVQGLLKMVFIDERVSTGRVIKGALLGCLIMETSMEEIPVIIMKKGEGSGITADSFIDFLLEYDDLRYRIQEGMIDYFDRKEVIRFRWEDEEFAKEIVELHSLD